MQPFFENLDKHCLFCDPALHGQDSQVLLRSTNFYLFAGLGAIRKGYIIIAPYSCESPARIRSLSELPADWYDELGFLRLLVAEFYREVYGTEALTFEHGRAGSCLTRTGPTQHCYHAHLCCYPFAGVAGESPPGNDCHGQPPLWDDIEGVPLLELSDVHELPSVVGSHPYLFLESVVVNPAKKPGSVGRERWQHRAAKLGGATELERQYLRRLLARRIGRPELWDWREYPDVEAVRSLRNEFAAFLASHRSKFAIDTQQDPPEVDFAKSVVAANKAGNDVTADEFNRLWGERLQHEALGEFLKHLRRVSKGNLRQHAVLDGGCGPGNYARAFYHQGFEVTGIDISKEMLDIARSVVGALPPTPAIANPPPLPRLEWGEASQPKFPSGSFHGIWYSAVVVHMPRAQLKPMLKRLHELLKPSGVLYLSAQLDGGTNQRMTLRSEGRVFFFYSVEELHECIQVGGFEILREWQDTASIGSRGDTNTKVWRQFVLCKSEAVESSRPSEVDSQLGSLGEAKLHQHILARLKTQEATGGGHTVLPAGDDCAAVAVPPQDVVVASTDPCPLPVLSMLEGDDYFRTGWFSMAIGLSDLAAMGAAPVGMLLALEARENMLLRDLDAFFDGVLEAGAEFDCPILGGNVKDAPRFNCVGTALGRAPIDGLLRRDAAQPKERVVVLGGMGYFWAGVLALQNGLPLDPKPRARLRLALERPWPRVREGRTLVERGLSRCAIDSSDGLTACFRSIAEASGVDVHLELARFEPAAEVELVASQTGIDARKLMLAWGDWELVCTVSASRLDELRHRMGEHGCPVADVGWVAEGAGNVWLHEEHHSASQLADFASTRFNARSYFTHGLSAYVHQLRHQPLAERE